MLGSFSFVLLESETAGSGIGYFFLALEVGDAHT